MSRPPFVPTPDMRYDFDVCRCGHDRWRHRRSMRCFGYPDCDCPEFRLDIAASPGSATSPEPQPDLDGQVLSLMQATEDLAELSIAHRDETAWFGSSSSVTHRTFCRVCVRAALNGAPIEHAPSCVVGIALKALEPLALYRVRPKAFSDSEVAAIRCLSVTTPSRIGRSHVEDNFLAGPVRHIEYEVEGHPWASEEGCAPPVRTHEEAAAARTEFFGDWQ